MFLLVMVWYVFHNTKSDASVWFSHTKMKETCFSHSQIGVKRSWKLGQTSVADTVYPGAAQNAGLYDVWNRASA